MQTLTKTSIIAAALGLSLAACNPVETGEAGNLEFQKTGAPDFGVDFDAPVAVGSSIDVLVREATAGGQEDRPVNAVLAAMSDNEEVLAVDGTSGSRLTLAALGEGEARIEVDAELASNDAITDAFTMATATADALELDHVCTGADDTFALQPAYLTGHDVLLEQRLMAADREIHGYGLYPVDITGTTDATIGESTMLRRLPIATGSTAGTATVDSQLGDGSLDVLIIRPAAITGATILEDFYTDGGEELSAVTIGNDTQVTVLPVAEGLAVLGEPAQICQADVEITATSETPEVCEAAMVTDDDEKANIVGLLAGEDNALRITGVSAGTCQVTVTLPAGNGGAGASTTLEFDVSS